MNKVKYSGRSRRDLPIESRDNGGNKGDLSYLKNIEHKPIETKVIGKTLEPEDALEAHNNRGRYEGFGTKVFEV